MVGKSENYEIQFLVVAQCVVINFQSLLTQGHWKIIHDQPRVQVLLDYTKSVLEMYQRK